MKSLKYYLIESAHTYTYRIKIAGELDKTLLDKFKLELEKFEVESITDVKTTPITDKPMDFPGLTNIEVNIFDVTIIYPASVQQLIEIARLCGFNPNMVMITTKDFDEIQLQQLAQIEKDTLLDNPYPGDTKEQKDLSKKYSSGFKDIVKNAANTKFEIAGNAKTKTTR